MPVANEDDVRVWAEELINDIRDLQETNGKDNYVSLLELAIEILDDELNAENLANGVVSEA